jgi:hypothetical protein
MFTVVRKEIFQFLENVGVYLQKNLHPLSSNLVRHLRFLDPQNFEQDTAGALEAIPKAAKEFRRLSDSQIDCLSLQWETFISFKFKKPQLKSINKYYLEGLNLVKQNNKSMSFTELDTFLQTSLSLLSANALVERGFSQTQLMLDGKESLSLHSLLGQRVIKEELIYWGGSEKIPITPALIACFGCARSKYFNRKEKEKKEKEREELERNATLEKQKHRDMAEKKKEDYLKKKNDLENEEKNLKMQLTFDEKRMEELEEKSEKVKSAEELKYCVVSLKTIRAGCKRKQALLNEITVKKLKLIEERGKTDKSK